MRRYWGVDEVLAYQEEHQQFWIYMNKEDKNIIVPRRDATLPWTFNAANPLCLGIMLMIIILVISGVLMGILNK